MPPFRDTSPVYGMDPETAARLVEAYRRARFSGTEEGRREAARILEEIRSGKYLPPIDWGQSEPVPEGTPADSQLLQTDILAPAVAPSSQPTGLPQPVSPGPTPRPVIYSDPRRTALLQEIRARKGTQRVIESQKPRPNRSVKPRGSKRIVTPPPGTARTRTELERREAVQQVRRIAPRIDIPAIFNLFPDFVTTFMPRRNIK